MACGLYLKRSSLQTCTSFGNITIKSYKATLTLIALLCGQLPGPYPSAKGPRWEIRVGKVSFHGVLTWCILCIAVTVPPFVGLGILPIYSSILKHQLGHFNLPCCLTGFCTGSVTGLKIAVSMMYVSLSS